jgi:hypothetical protein
LSQQRRLELLIVKNTQFLYTTMMSKPTLLPAILFVSLLAPVAAIAYTEPQDALSEGNYQDGFLIPPTKREVEARVEAQRLASEKRRNAEQAATFGGGTVAEGDTDDDTTHAAADDESVDPDLADVLTSIEQTLSDIKEDSQDAQTLRRERALDRLEAIEAERGHGAAYINAGQSLHSGAPLAPTGPESWMAGGAVLLAIAWTLWRSRKEAIAA